MAAYKPNLSDPDYVKGLDVLKRFYDYSKSMFPKNVTYTFQTMIETLGARKGQVAFVESLGLIVREVGFSTSKIQSAMKSLAQRAQGKIPSKNGDFYMQLQDEGAKIEFVDAFKYVTVETAKDVGKGLVEVGNTLITTGKMLNFVFPALVGVVVYFWIMKQKK